MFSKITTEKLLGHTVGHSHTRCWEALQACTGRDLPFLKYNVCVQRVREWVEERETENEMRKKERKKDWKQGQKEGKIMQK